LPPQHAPPELVAPRVLSLLRVDQRLPLSSSLLEGRRERARLAPPTPRLRNFPRGRDEPLRRHPLVLHEAWPQRVAQASLGEVGAPVLPWPRVGPRPPVLPRRPIGPRLPALLRPPDGPRPPVSPARSARGGDFVPSPLPPLLARALWAGHGVPSPGPLLLWPRALGAHPARAPLPRMPLLRLWQRTPAS
jgi:hypothetical protein